MTKHRLNTLKTENTESGTHKTDSDKDSIISSGNNLAPKPKRKISKRSIWTIKITITTFILALVVSFITEITSSKSHVIVSIILLCLLILISIIFDAIGVAATSCDLAPLLSMSSRKVKGASIAVKLVKNAEKVSNICSDVVGDMCGIVSGTCTAAILLKFTVNNPSSFLLSMLLTALVSAVMVGGKAFFKEIAIKNSKEMILFASRAIGIFYRPKSK